VSDPSPSLHPRNSGFQWRDVRRSCSLNRADPCDYRRITQAQAECFDRDGFFVMKHAIDGVTLGRIEAEVDRLLSPILTINGTATKGTVASTHIASHIVTQSPYLRTFLALDTFRDLAWDLLGPSVRVYWDQAVYKTKDEGAADFLWHQDNGNSYIEPQNYLTCWIALTEATRANGCLWMFPGSHRLGMLAHEDTTEGLICRLMDTDKAVPIEVEAGAIVVFSSLTPHRSGPNISRATRKAYIVQYALDGSIVFRDPSHGIHEDLAMNDPVRQFLIMSDGKPVALNDIAQSD